MIDVLENGKVTNAEPMKDCISKLGVGFDWRF